MPSVSMLPPWPAAALVLGVLTVGAYLAAVLTYWVDAGITGSAPARVIVAPLRAGALLLQQRATTTERPDAVLWLVAPAAYAAMAAAALCVVPIGEHLAVADVRTGIVLYGAAEALVIVAVFLHGWASNSHLALIGGFRFVAVALSYELLSMFVLIAAALPAESLQVSAIVEAQAGLWNVLRQPLGLPLWIVVTWGVTFTGPLSLADGTDLVGGTSVEASGRALLLWKVARGGMLTVSSAMGAAVFLGGWHGPWLAGWGWMAIKTLAVMLVVIWLGRRLARVPAERAMRLLWIVGLPLSFVGLLEAGIEALL